MHNRSDPALVIYDLKPKTSRGFSGDDVADQCTTLIFPINIWNLCRSTDYAPSIAIDKVILSLDGVILIQSLMVYCTRIRSDVMRYLSDDVLVNMVKTRKYEIR